MRILLINANHQAVGSRIPDEHLPPLGLLAIGGPLIDDGHEVSLLDAESGPMSTHRIVYETLVASPDVVMFGYSGSTAAEPVVAEVSGAIRAVMPSVYIIYGGGYPTYHWHDVLVGWPQIDVVVRGEGEETVRRLVRVLEQGKSMASVDGIAFCKDGVTYSTRTAKVIHDLDDYRIGWELIDFSHYSYWNKQRAVTARFSRSFPHLCNYCGQQGLGLRHRHRDPRKFASELAWLHRKHGVEAVNLADEDPAASKQPWWRFLEAMIAEDVPLILAGSIWADDIVRDTDILHLYKKAGFERLLLGAASNDTPNGENAGKDFQAIQLLRQHDILPMPAWENRAENPVAVGWGRAGL